MYNKKIIYHRPIPLTIPLVQVMEGTVQLEWDGYMQLDQ